MHTSWTRRRLVRATSLAAVGTLAAPYVKRAHSAGTVTLGLWDHWVPGANDQMVELCNEWGGRQQCRRADQLHHLDRQPEPPDGSGRSPCPGRPRHPLAPDLSSRRPSRCPLHLSRREQQAALVEASQGFDMPMIKSFDDFETYAAAELPSGTLFNYPVQGDETMIVAGWPAPPAIAANIYLQALIPNMIARVTVDGESHDDAIDWASSELEGFMRG